MIEEKPINAVITVIYKDKEYKSCPIKLVDNSEDTIALNSIANYGTDKLNMFKMPLDAENFIVFSRKQLDEAVFVFNIFREEEKPKTSISLKKSQKSLQNLKQK